MQLEEKKDGKKGKKAVTLLENDVDSRCIDHVSSEIAVTTTDCIRSDEALLRLYRLLRFPLLREVPPSCPKSHQPF